MIWTGISFIVAGLISIGLAITGEGSPSFIEQIIGYGYGWIALGIGLIIFGFFRKKPINQ